MNHNLGPDAARLIDILRETAAGGLALACSGGVDSALLAWAAKTAGISPLLAVFFRTPLNTAEDEAAAQAVAKQLELELQIIDLDPLALAAMARNSRDRCYHCKKHLFQALRTLAAEKGIVHIAEGGNMDDEKTYRPGAAACRELGVLQPLAQAGLGKAVIRDLARAAGLPVAERPSSPCLASRFPYDTPLTLDKLNQAREGEALLRAMGFTEFRLRSHDRLCRLELPPAAWPALLAQRETLISGLKALGWQHITLDLEGLQSGSFDR